MTIYQVKEDTHLDFTRGLTNLHLGPWDNRAQYHILPNHLQKGLHTEFLSDSVTHPAVRYSSEQQATLIHWQGKTIALIRKPFSGSKPPQPVSVDYVIVADNSFHNLTQLNAYFSYHQLIVDGTNSYYVAKKLAKEAADEHIAFHSVPEQGALTISWKP